jgi:uncharacterized coiled-coil DUF342 family protein
MNMESVETVETRQRVAKWLEEGQQIVNLLPALHEERGRLRARAEAAEREAERLRQELAGVRGENQAYRVERDEIGEALTKLMNEMLASVNEVVQRFRAPQRKSPFERDARTLVP